MHFLKYMLLDFPNEYSPRGFYYDGEAVGGVRSDGGTRQNTEQTAAYGGGMTTIRMEKLESRESIKR